MSGNLPSRGTAVYARQLQQLLPTGAAWTFAPGGTMARLLEGLAVEFSRVDARSSDLVDEADPRTALELLTDWERVAGLPDACTGAPEDTAERQIALHQKLTGIGTQSRNGYIELAARIGYQAEIEEHVPARVGMRAGQPANGPDWAFAWTVHIQPAEGTFSSDGFIAYAEAGDRVGVRVRGFGSFDLECVIRRAAPAHTHVLFAYEIEPQPALWIDFTR